MMNRFLHGMLLLLFVSIGGFFSQSAFAEVDEAAIKEKFLKELYKQVEGHFGRGNGLLKKRDALKPLKVKLGTFSRGKNKTFYERLEGNGVNRGNFKDLIGKAPAVKAIVKQKVQAAKKRLRIKAKQKLAKKALKIEERADKLADAHVNAKVDEIQGNADSKRMVRRCLIYGTFIVVLVAGMTVIHYGAEYLNDKYRMPSVVTESSRKSSLARRLFPWAFKKEEKAPLSLDKLILPETTKADIREIAALAREAKRAGLNYSNVLLYGPPGTGKSYGARIIAQQSGLDYAIVPGSAFTQLPMGQDIVALEKMFNWADSSKDGLIIFIDEAESLLRKRDGKSRKAANLLNYFLSKVQRASSPKLMFIFATNHPKRLDSAVDTRVSRRILIPLPGQEERTSLLNLYINDEISDKGFAVSDNVINAYPDIAQKLEGASARAIQDLAVQVQQMLILNGKKELDTSDLHMVADRLIRQNTETHNFGPAPLEWLHSVMGG